MAVLPFPTAQVRALAEAERCDRDRQRIDALDRTPEALAWAVQREIDAGRPEVAGQLVGVYLGRWLRADDRTAMAEAFARLARLELPALVQAAVRHYAEPVRGTVLGAAWWLRP